MENTAGEFAELIRYLQSDLVPPDGMPSGSVAFRRRVSPVYLRRNADDVLVELRYNELLVPTDGNYQFVFPTVVGPRYAGTTSKAPSETGSGQTTGHAQAFPAQPVLPAGEVSPAEFGTLDVMVAELAPRSLPEPPTKIMPGAPLGRAQWLSSTPMP